MKHKLYRLRTPWRRWLVGLVISALVAFSRRPSPRARIHWVVGPVPRPRRLERTLLAFLFVLAPVVLEPRQYLFWAVLWGSGASVYVIVHSLHLLYRKININQESLS